MIVDFKARYGKRLMAASPVIGSGGRHVIGNWKMNGGRRLLPELHDIARHARLVPQLSVSICLPATLISSAVAELGGGEGLSIGGQDCHWQSSGAFTGHISASMLADAGAALVIVGHSECREYGGSSESIAKKAEAALAAGLTAVICVGEPDEINASGEAKEWVSSQLKQSLPRLGRDRIVIAYEPVWAIGTGRIPAPDHVRTMHAVIRSTLLAAYPSSKNDTAILYGGSADRSNAFDLLSIAGVSGLLVGGASLTAAAFTPILDAAARLMSNEQEALAMATASGR